MEPKPLIDVLEEYFEEVRQQRFEARVWMLLDRIMRGETLPNPNIED